ISQDSDIEHIYIDGLHNIIKGLDNEGLEAFVKEVEAFSVNENVDFTMIISTQPEDVPAYVAKYIV
ncbi:MAG: hypothetical protein ACRCW1_05130, partial [Anaerotignaceae bacterium]